MYVWYVIGNTIRVLKDDIGRLMAKCPVENQMRGKASDEIGIASGNYGNAGIRA